MPAKPPSSRSSTEKISIRFHPRLDSISNLYSTRAINSMSGMWEDKKLYVRTGVIISNRLMVLFGS